MPEYLPIHRLVEFGIMSENEVDRFRALGGPPVTLPRHAVIRSEGSNDRAFYLLVEGWAVASMLLRTGERQIVKLHLPGDVLGFSSICMDVAIDTMTALTPVTVRKVMLEELGAFLAECPSVATFLLLTVQKERIGLMDRLATVARSNAVARIAAFLLDLNERLSVVGQAYGNQFDLRITQEQIGDLLGLTSVHVNRMMRQLVTEKMIERRGSNVRLVDMEGLRQSAAVPQRAMSQDMSWLNPAQIETTGTPAEVRPLRR